MWGCTCSSEVVQAGAVHHSLLGAPACTGGTVASPKDRVPYCPGVPRQRPVWRGRELCNLHLCTPSLTPPKTGKAESGKWQVLGHPGLPSENVFHHRNGAITC